MDHKAVLYLRLCVRVPYLMTPFLMPITISTAMPDVYFYIDDNQIKNNSVDIHKQSTTPLNPMYWLNIALLHLD